MENTRDTIVMMYTRMLFFQVLILNSRTTTIWVHANKNTDMFYSRECDEPVRLSRAMHFARLACCHGSAFCLHM